MTVSRVLNKVTTVNEEIRDRVLAAVKELDYRPNISARSLVRSRSYLLGLIYDNPSAAYMSEFLLGSMKQCREAGYHLVVEPCGDNPDKWSSEILSYVKESRLDGIIMPPPVCDDQTVLENLRENNVPHVRISPGKDVSGSPVVFIDDKSAVKEMTLYLMDSGHKRIGFISGHPNQNSSRLRYQGFCAAFRERGLPMDESLVVQGFYSYRSGLVAAELLLNRPNPPTAIFAGNDDMAVAVYACAQRHKLQIPDQLSVAGFDDTTTATMIWPALTTIRQPIAAMASEAIKLLVRKIDSNTEQRDSDQVPLEYELIKRDSVVPPRRD